jgi:WD40 repeat protein
MIYHRQIIDQHPLQIYASSLIFSPIQSITKTQFKPLSWIIGSPAIEQNWSSCLLTIENTKDYSPSLENIAWSPDGTQIASQDYVDVKIWNSMTGQCTATLRGHTDQVIALAWSQGGRLASACQAGEVRIWDTITHQCSKVFKGEDGYLFALVWSPDGSQIARTTIPVSWTPNYVMLKKIDWRQEGLVWDTVTGEEISNVRPFLSLGWSMGRFLTISPLGVDGVSIQEFATGQEVCVLKDTLDQEYSSAPFEKVFWGPDQIAISHHTHINIWDIKTCTLVSTLRYLPGDMSSPITTLSWSQDGIRIASGNAKMTAVYIWDERSTQETLLFEHRGSTHTLLWSPNSTKLASCSQDGAIRIWDPAFGESATTTTSTALDLHPEPVKKLTWSPNLKYLVSSSPLADDTNGSRWTNWTTCKVWDPSTSQCLLNRESVGSHTWSPDGNRIALMTEHGIEMHSLENATYNSMSKSPGFNSPPSQAFSPHCLLAWSHHGDTLACSWLTGITSFWSVTSDFSLGALDQDVKFFDKASPEKPSLWSNASRHIQALSWSEDDSALAIAATDEIKILDTKTNQWTISIGDQSPLPELEFRTLAWSKDGTRIAASGYHWVKMWSVAGVLLANIEIPRLESRGCLVGNIPGETCYKSHIDDVQFDGSSRDRLRVVYDEIYTSYYQLPDVLPDTDPLAHFSQPILGYGWDSVGNWITYEGTRILKVPAEYRVQEWAAATVGGKLALGCRSGQVLIFQFSHSP